VTSKETIGQRLRRLRKERGLNQRDLSGEGISYAYISRIEADQRRPSLRMIRLLAERLDISAEYLETGRDVPEQAERELRLTDAELELRLGRDLKRARKTLSQLIAEDSGDRIATRARAVLGTLAAREGDHKEAVRQLEAATAGGIRPRQRSDVYETLAASYVALGRYSSAEELLERCVEAVDDVTLKVRYRSFLGMTLMSTGRTDRARAVLSEAVELAEDYAVPSARVVLYWTLARAAWMERDSSSALSYMSRAIALLETTEDTLQLARAHLTCGQFCNLDGDYAQARRYLDRAERLLELAGDNDDLGILHAEQAKSLTQLGFVDEAIDRATEAVRLLEGDLRYVPTAWHALAVARAKADDFKGAEPYFRRAIDTQAELGQWRQASQAARDWANALRQVGREQEAFEALDQATAFALRDPTPAS
jgi:tetratricopeptide (TPR) repeat protein